MILLSPEHTYTYVDIDYFQLETLKNATLCFDVLFSSSPFDV